MRKLWNALRRRKTATETEHRHEMFRHLPFPFQGDRFPAGLGAVIQRTVYEGQQPAREVIHTLENSWLVGDGATDPNAPGAAIAACIVHVIEQNSSVAQLANLPLGHIARRDDPDSPWVIEHFEWEHDEHETEQTATPGSSAESL